MHSITKTLIKLTLTHSAPLKRLVSVRRLWLLACILGSKMLTAKIVADVSVLDTVSWTVFGDLDMLDIEITFVTEIKKLLA